MCPGSTASSGTYGPATPHSSTGKWVISVADTDHDRRAEYVRGRRGPKPCEIDLNERERGALSDRARSPYRRHRQRALIVLYAADGIPNRQIATLVGLNQNQVGMWRKRYATLGLMGLNDLPRSGRPRRLIDGHGGGPA
jgi:hypothetical protein